MDFTKMNGLGNDFIIINNIEEGIALEKFENIAVHLCNRRKSIGADGLMVVTKAEDKGDYRMNFYNSDGSLGEMCGNGARCIARYGYENGLASSKQIIETTAGVVVGERINERIYKVKINNPTKILRGVNISGIGVCDYIELGKPGLPHAVINYPNLDEVEDDKLRELGKRIRNNNIFSNGANVNFYDIVDKQIIVKTYERGVENLTLACGTGSCSVAIILFLNGLVKGRNIKINVPGGQLYVDIKTERDKIDELYLTGLTNMVAIGKVLDEEIAR